MYTSQGFDPVLREGEWLDYIHNPQKSIDGVMADQVRRIERAEGIVSETST